MVQTRSFMAAVEAAQSALSEGDYDLAYSELPQAYSIIKALERTISPDMESAKPYVSWRLGSVQAIGGRRLMSAKQSASSEA